MGFLRHFCLMEAGGKRRKLNLLAHQCSTKLLALACLCLIIIIFSITLFGLRPAKSITMLYVDTEEDTLPYAVNCMPEGLQVVGESKRRAGFAVCHIGKMVELYSTDHSCTFHFIGRQKVVSFEKDLNLYDGGTMKSMCSGHYYKIKTPGFEPAPRGGTCFASSRSVQLKDLTEMYGEMKSFNKSFPLLKIDIGVRGAKLAVNSVTKFALRPCLLLVSLPGPFEPLKKLIEQLLVEGDYLLFGARSWISDQEVVQEIEQKKLHRRNQLNVEPQKRQSHVENGYKRHFAELISKYKIDFSSRGQQSQRPMHINERRRHVRSKMYNLSFVHRKCTQRSNNRFSYTAFWKFNFFFDEDA